MTIQTLMTQPATLLHLDGDMRGPAGGSEPLYTEEAITGYFEPEAPIGLEGETIQQGNFTLGRWFGAVPADTNISGHDIILYDELMMELTGPPRLMWNPRLNAASHYELSMRVVETTEVPES